MMPSAITGRTLMVVAASMPALALAAPQPQFQVADVAEQVLPAVVSIRTVQEVDVDDFPPFLQRFFEDGIPEEMRDEVREGQGSGVMISDDGLLVTNHHVVAGADELYVQLHDETEYVAELVASDPDTDLALLRLEGDVARLPHLNWGDSDGLRLGEVVLAVGNPFGLSGTVTMGIVSALSRETDAYTPFIQTDAAINPGNSGGALVDMEGNLVGINTQILSRTGGNLGIGFAIPSATAERVVQQLSSSGRVAHGWLGVSIQPITPDLAEEMGFADYEGVLVSYVEPGSPADDAGVRRGDLISHVASQPTESPDDLAKLVGREAPGERVELAVVRNGKPRALHVVLGERPEVEEDVANSATLEVPDTVELEDVPVLEGLELAALDATTRERYKVGSRRTEAVVITGIRPRTPASAQRLEEGDLILEVNNRAVATPADVRRAIEEPHKAVLLVARGEQTFFVMLKT